MLMICRRALAFALPLIATLVSALPLHAAKTHPGKTRHYYIAAEEVTWDFAPTGRDLVHGRNIPAPWNGQRIYKKTRYIEYTDATFTVRKPQPDWLGILGPVIRAEVGDTILVDFLNRTDQPHSIHPHGLRYDKANEGAAYLPYGAGAGVGPDAHYTYRWHADSASGPATGGPSSVVWWYHSHVDAEREINAGLLGPIIVTAAGKAGPDAAPRDVDREFVTLFMIFDEQQGKDAGLFHTINGYVFGNLPGLIMKQGDRVRWHLLSMGNEKDLHTPHWHGKTVNYGARHVDVVELLPGSMATADMIADNPGTWLFHCHVSDHMEGGMMATYTIYPPRRACPIKFVPDDWQHMNESSRLRIRSASSKPIRQVNILSGYLENILELRPLFVNWSSNGPLLPSREQSVEVGTEMFSGEKNLGVAFFPSRIVFEDGTEWKPQQLGDCFHVYWRSKDHPQLPVLP